MLSLAGLRIRVGGGRGGLALIIGAFVMLASFVVGILCFVTPNTVLKGRIGLGMDFVADVIADIAERAPSKHRLNVVRLLGLFAIVIPSAICASVYGVFFHEPSYQSDFAAEEVEMLGGRTQEALATESGEAGGVPAAPQASPTPAPEARIDAMIAEASRLWRAGDTPGAVAQARTALALCNEHLGRDHPKTAQVQGMIDSAARRAVPAQ